MRGPSVQSLFKQKKRSKKRKGKKRKEKNINTAISSSIPDSDLHSFSAPVDGHDSEEFRQGMLPSVPSASFAANFDPSPKNDLANLYQRVGITPVETPPNQRLTRLYYESAGILPSLNGNSSSRNSQNNTPSYNRRSEDMVPTTSVSVQPAALENWLDGWLHDRQAQQQQQINNGNREEDDPAATESKAVRVLMHLASRSGWTSAAAAKTTTASSSSPSNNHNNNNVSFISELVPEAIEVTKETEETELLPTATVAVAAARANLPVPQRYFLTPMFAHPDDHALFSRKHWRAESAGGNSNRNGSAFQSTSTTGARPIGGSAGTLVTVDPDQDLWGQLVPDRGPTFEPKTLLDPNDFGRPRTRKEKKILEGDENREVDKNEYVNEYDNESNQNGYDDDEEEEEEEEDPAQISLRCGLLLGTGMFGKGILTLVFLLAFCLICFFFYFYIPICFDCFSFLFILYSYSNRIIFVRCNIHSN